MRIERKSIPLNIILSIVTCGIYALYWMAKLNDDVNVVSGRTSDTSGGMVVLLGIVTCGIYALYWYYTMGSKLDDAMVAIGLPSKNQGLIYLLLGVFGLGFVGMALAQSNLNDHFAA